MGVFMYWCSSIQLNLFRVQGIRLGQKGRRHWPCLGKESQLAFSYRRFIWIEGKNNEAGPLYQQALTICEKALGSELREEQMEKVWGLIDARGVRQQRYDDVTDERGQCIIRYKNKKWVTSRTYIELYNMRSIYIYLGSW